MKIFKEDLVLTENTLFNESIKVEGNIRCEGGFWDLKCRDLHCGDLDCRDLDCWDLDCRDLHCGDLDCRDLDCWDLHCGNLDCRDLDCRNLDCRDLHCGNLDCRNLHCGDLNYYAFAIAYNSFKCQKVEGRRLNSFAKCLDGEIEIKEEKVCSKCGQKIQNENI